MADNHMAPSDQAMDDIAPDGIDEMNRMLPMTPFAGLGSWQ